MRGTLVVFVAVLYAASVLHAQIKTVGVFKKDSLSFAGYTLIAPISARKTYLIDNCGRKIHEWQNRFTPAFSVSLTYDGDLLRTNRLDKSPIHGGAGGGVELVAWDGIVKWSYEVSDSTRNMHHDAIMMPNGHVLIVVAVAVPRADVIAAGRDSSKLLSDMWIDKIQEIRPIGTDSGEVVWEWFTWDHTIQDRVIGLPNYGIISEHPGRVDLNYHTDAQGVQYRDWTHINSIDYNPTTDQILVSVRTFDEVWIIDHSTTTAQARGVEGGNCERGGEILYRWGNPFAYKRGTLADRTLFSQHCAKWIPNGIPGAGSISIFNNGANRPGTDYSSVEVFAPPIDAKGIYTIESVMPFAPVHADWTYTATTSTDFFSGVFGGVQRLPNGNTLITSGLSGKIFEVDINGEVHWDYMNPVGGLGPVNQGTPANDNMVYSSWRYPPSHHAFQDKQLTPGARLEITPFPDSCTVDYTTTSISDSPLQEEQSVYYVYDAMGRACGAELTTLLSAEETLQNLPTGAYFIINENGRTCRALYLRR